MNAEGWYQDPFQLHGDRWFSDGRPTALVRDGGQESHDPPPVAEYAGPLEDVIPIDPPFDGNDLARADDPSATPFKLCDGSDAALSSFGTVGPIPTPPPLPPI
jgi:hypothetical protein